jgi:hypothetical protein
MTYGLRTLLIKHPEQLIVGASGAVQVSTTTARKEAHSAVKVSAACADLVLV